MLRSWRSTRVGVRTAARALFSACALFVAPSFAQNVAVVLSEEGPAYTEMVEVMRRTAEAEHSEIKFLATPPAANTSQGAEIFQTDFYSLIVTVGVRAANRVAGGDPKPPVLATLIPKATYEKLMQRRAEESGARRWSAIYLDQPFARQLNFLQFILPGKSRLGVLYGPTSIASASPLERAARSRALVVESERVDRMQDVGGALGRILGRAEVLLALPDPDVFNKSTVQQILFSSFQSNDPVVAFSAAYVKAGALGAVFSTPKQIARQSAQVAMKAKQRGQMVLPPPEYPRYWAVEVNRNIARGLRIALPDDVELTRRLAALMEGEP
jgi:putative tryptophan/tyrosine transport system substrate-binding protein